MAAEKIVAFDLGAQQVSAAVFSKGPGNNLVLEQIQSSGLLADPAADGTRLDQSKLAVAELAKELKIKNSAVRYAISSQSVFTRFVALPPLDTDQVDQIVGFEARQQVPFPLEEAVWDYQALGSPDDIEVEVVLAAIKADELNDINSIVRGNGLETKLVDLAPMALYNAFRWNYPDIDGSVVLIDVGARTTNLIYCEGPKVFVRNITVGGRDITSAIAREFDISFQEAEERKIQDGFVALGGGYADHEDPEIAAMSKVIRQASARLHSEIIRTNNFYRSNQGGSAPQMAFLCGAGSGLPYLNEFLQEKLHINVDYFNSLRNVQVGKKVDETAVTKMAHSMGELVGLGLRAFPDCPMELNLVPRIVAREAQIQKRAPALWMALFCAAAMIAASGFFFQNAVNTAKDETIGLDFDINGPLASGQTREAGGIDVSYDDFPMGTYDDPENPGKTITGPVHPRTEEPSRNLDQFNSEIVSLVKSLEKSQADSEPYTEAVYGRIYWVSTFNELASYMKDDRIWFTEMQPFVGDRVVLEALGDQDGQVGVVGNSEKSAELVEAGTHQIDRLVFKGLYRALGDGSDSDVVYDYAGSLYASPKFDLATRDENGVIKLGANGKPEPRVQIGNVLTYLDEGSANDRHAWVFEMKLPLPANRRISFSK
ncbi:MAG: type IV pilus assembly protein PilM [Verrucomicrobiales bacterium]|jgi:type IV pilus assembly protein PilM